MSKVEELLTRVGKIGCGADGSYRITNEDLNVLLRLAWIAIAFRQGHATVGLVEFNRRGLNTDMDEIERVLGCVAPAQREAQRFPLFTNEEAWNRHVESCKHTGLDPRTGLPVKKDPTP